MTMSNSRRVDVCRVLTVVGESPRASPRAMRSRAAHSSASVWVSSAVGEVAGRVWVTCIPRRRERPAQLFANHDGTRRAPRSDGYLRVRVGIGPEVAWRGHASRRSRADGAATFGDVSRDRRGTWGWGWLYARVGDVVGRAGMVKTHFECKIPTGQNVSRIVA